MAETLALRLELEHLPEVTPVELEVADSRVEISIRVVDSGSP